MKDITLVLVPLYMSKEKKSVQDKKRKKAILAIVLLSVFVGTNLLLLLLINLTYGLLIHDNNTNAIVREFRQENRTLKYNALKGQRKEYCKQSDSARRPVDIEVKFYDQLKKDIKIPTLCTDCKIRGHGEVISTNPHTEELIGLKYITIREKDTYFVAHILTNSNYSQFYEIVDPFQRFSEPNEGLFDQKYDIDCVTKILPDGISKEGYFKSSKNLYYGPTYSFNQSKEFTELDIKQVDSYKDIPIYEDKNKKGAYYVKGQDLFLSPLKYIPSISLLGEDSPYPIIWNDETTNTAMYRYGYYDACMADSSWEAEETKDDLKITGYRKGTEQPIYEHKDPQNPELKKLYNEDYLEQNYKYEDNPNNDPPLTYEEYLAKHPIIFWEDEVGRIIKFYKKDYIIEGGCAKPIIYLYPEKDTTINVKVIPTTGKLTFTYPKYDGMWTVLSDKNSSITDKDGNKHEYLWWESTSEYLPEIKDGFVVKNEDLDTFFDSTLAKAGFNQKEIKDFKEFWVPTMRSQYSPYFKIHFLQNKDVDILARLLIDPKPQTEIRIFMMYERLNNFEEIKPQEIKNTPREGYTVTEWGGTRR